MVLGKDLIRTSQADGFRSFHINIAVLSTLGGSRLISENFLFGVSTPKEQAGDSNYET